MKDNYDKIVYRVNTYKDSKTQFKHECVFFTDSLDYYDQSDTGYDKKDVQKYYLNLKYFKVFDPVKEWEDDIEIESWSVIRTSEEFANEKDLYITDYLDEVDYDNPNEYHEVLIDTDSLAEYGRDNNYDVTIIRDVPQLRSNKTFNEYVVHNSDCVKSINVAEDVNSKQKIESSRRAPIYLYRGVNERSFSKNHRPVSGLFFGIKKEYVAGWGNVKRYVLDKNAKIYEGHSSDAYCNENNLYDKDYPQFKEYFGMYTDFTRLQQFVDVSEKDKDEIETKVEKYAGAQFCWMDVWTWCLQLVAKLDLESKGYDGAKWFHEDFGNPVQYQIWNLNVVKSKDGVVESLDKTNLNCVNETLNESKQDIEKFKKWAGEELANRFFNVKDRLQGEKKDIYYWMTTQVKRYGDANAKKVLNAYIEHLEDTPTNSQVRKRGKEGAVKIYEDSKWLVYDIQTYEASVLYGKNTEWCVTGNNSEQGKRDFNLHTNGNKLYFYIEKGGKNRKFALEFNNIHDWCLWNEVDFVEVGEGELFKKGVNACGDSWNPSDTNNYPALPHIKGLSDIQKAYVDVIKQEENLNEDIDFDYSWRGWILPTGEIISTYNGPHYDNKYNNKEKENDIRYNFGYERYVGLPKTRPTNKQLEVLTELFDYYFIDAFNVGIRSTNVELQFNLGSKNNYKIIKISPTSYTTDEVIKLIKRTYSSLNNINESNDTFKTQTSNSVINQARKDLEEQGYKLETLNLERLVKDNNLLNKNIYNHEELWGNNPDDYIFGSDEIRDWKYSDIMSCTYKNGKYVLDNGRHRVRALYNDGYKNIEILVYYEDKTTNEQLLSKKTRVKLINKSKRDLSKSNLKEFKCTISEVPNIDKEINELYNQLKHCK